MVFIAIYLAKPYCLSIVLLIPFIYQFYGDNQVITKCSLSNVYIYGHYQLPIMMAHQKKTFYVNYGFILVGVIIF